MVSEIDGISQEVFSVGFPHRLPVNLIALHDSFFDFANFHLERNPEKYETFYEKITQSGILCHIADRVPKKSE